MIRKKVLAISGSTRAQSTNRMLLNAISTLYLDVMEVAQFPSIADLPHFNPDLDKNPPPHEVAAFRKQLQESDGVLICTPEYAMGVPGTLKNAFDWIVSSMELAHKPVALITASLAGQKAHASLMETLKVIECNVPESSTLVISFVKTKIKDDQIVDEATLQQVHNLMSSFLNTMRSAVQSTYTNPLTQDDFPDASIIHVKDEGYFAYATHDASSPTIRSILVKHSWDLINWSESKPALVAPPVWASKGEQFWCPHVVKVQDQYRMYYAAEPDTKDGMCLAFATSDRPVDFVDIGAPLQQKRGSSYEMIDPCFFIDPVSGKHLLYYGSAHTAIQVLELSEDGHTIISDPLPVLYPGVEKFHRLREGAFVTYSAKWTRYFLWVSGDNTWAENSYAVSVYWSASPLSIFTKIPGDHIVLKPNKHWDSPGHNSIIIDAAETEWMIYHAVDVNDRFIPGTDRFLRKMCMEMIRYTDDGWPFIQDSSPSFTPQPGPTTFH